ncbi:MAG: SsrA-binding protein SmpB [Candidatus Cloacimonadota bacterium]|jgi:SsrA-binding protein|nr:MAG: SsrA-binding protein SmpB [Candidatus Cloacimonadota bacterium]
MRTLATNRKARHLYNIESTIESGIVLIGCEVKSVKASKISLVDSYARIDDGEVFLFNLHISPYDKIDHFTQYKTQRRRKLLLKKAEIRKLTGKLQEKGYTLVPLRIYVTDRGIVKVELGLARGKKKFEKRQVIKERDMKRELERERKGIKR